MTFLDDHVSCTDPSVFVSQMLMFCFRSYWPSSRGLFEINRQRHVRTSGEYKTTGEPCFLALPPETYLSVRKYIYASRMGGWFHFVQRWLN